MPPKKREKDGETSKNQRVDTLKSDHDMFLQAFEKPTQIYRYLRERNATSPIFLYRNLTYMRYRMSRSHKSREGFKVDSILEKVKSKHQLVPEELRGGFMTLTFLGFYDKNGEIIREREPVKVDTLLLKICHKKRKDSAPYLTVTVGTCFVPINPSEEYPPPKAPTVQVSTDEFDVTFKEIASHHLLLRVYNMNNGLNGSTTDQETGEPLQKRRKASVNREEVKIYGTDLVIYDKYKRCILGDGDYELLLDEMKTARNLPKKYPSWEPIGDISDDTNAFELFANGPTLKFKLEWSQEKRSSYVDRPRLTPVQEGETLDSNSNKENKPAVRKPVNEKKDQLERKSSAPPGPKPAIIYQFHYNNNSRQQTEPCRDLHCPWCSLDCGTLYALLKHLKLCHARFTFTYIPMSDMARIDVAINELYDGSYTGSPHDVIAQPGGRAFSRGGPQIRSVVSNLVVCHPKRPKPTLTEFMELEEESGDLQRSFITGHNRLYHHTVTCLPVHPKEMDNDSEGEHDPKWLQTKTMMMIDEFTDVNEGEKELMKMWNLHVMKEQYVGDCQIPIACKMFLEKKGRELLDKNLYRNFVVHMCSLFDFGLVSPVVLYQTIQKLHSMIEESHAKILQMSWEAQREHWIKSERQNTPSHFKTHPGPVSHPDPNVRRKLYSPGAFQSDSPNRRHTQQRKEVEEDDDDDDDDDEEEEEEDVVKIKVKKDELKVLKKEADKATKDETKVSKKEADKVMKDENGSKMESDKDDKTELPMCVSSGLDMTKNGSSGQNGEKRKASGERSASAASANNVQKGSLVCKAPNGSAVMGASSGGTEGLKKKISPSTGKASPTPSMVSTPTIEPPTKKKLIVTNANGKPQAVSMHSASTNTELKRKMSLGMGSNTVPNNPSNMKKKVVSQRPSPQTNGVPPQSGLKVPGSQTVSDLKKRASVLNAAFNQLKATNANVTNLPATANLEVRKKPVVNGVMTQMDQACFQKKKLPQQSPSSPVQNNQSPNDNKLMTNCTVELVHCRRDSKDSTSSSSSSLSTASSDAKRKSSLGQNHNGTSNNQQENCPQRRKSVCAESSPVLESGMVSLRRKSFSSNQSIEPSSVSPVPNKGITS